MNSLKKGEEVPLLNFEGGPGSPVPDPRVPRSWVPESWPHFYTMPINPVLLIKINERKYEYTLNDYLILPSNTK